ncbi:hypothetical protein [Vibrio anguillarum]|uniref:hypothetical protein n=1 Tax=Vibrio anguillarum TaxID=55601 RepID=UPI000B53A7CB|nr:hypothetical protein [Vibrio anguillarum]ASG05362.1 hypothetical protein CEJ46_16145 [Vibrio anguillarum]
MEIEIRSKLQAPNIIEILGEKITIPANSTFVLDTRVWLEIKVLKPKWIEDGWIYPETNEEEVEIISRFRIAFIEKLELEGVSRVQSQLGGKHNFSAYELQLAKKWIADHNDMVLMEVREQTKESIELSRLSRADSRFANRIALGALVVSTISLLVALLSASSP